jgi:hypothetical protein
MAEFALPGECPPKESAPTSGTYYRFVEPQFGAGEQSGRGSWRKPHKTAGPMKGRTDLCGAHGLSIYKSLEETQTFRDFSPWAASKSVAEVIINPDNGVVLHTPTDSVQSHHDWWTEPYDYTPVNMVVDGPREE